MDKYEAFNHIEKAVDLAIRHCHTWPYKAIEDLGEAMCVMKMLVNTPTPALRPDRQGK